MAIILQLTESEKCALVNCYMDQRSNVEYMLTFYSKSNLNNKDNHKLFIENHITVEEVSLPISGTPTQVYFKCILNNILNALIYFKILIFYRIMISYLLILQNKI